MGGTVVECHAGIKVTAGDHALTVLNLTLNSNP